MFSQKNAILLRVRVKQKCKNNGILKNYYTYVHINSYQISSNITRPQSFLLVVMADIKHSATCDVSPGTTYVKHPQNRQARLISFFLIAQSAVLFGFSSQPCCPSTICFLIALAFLSCFSHSLLQSHYPARRCA